MDLVQWIETNQKTFTDLSDSVWGFAEIGYKEVKSSALLIKALEGEGFTVEKGVAEIPTAFVASYTKGAGPVIGILGEFDALPGLSQDCVPYRKPLVSGAPGHYAVEATTNLVDWAELTNFTTHEATFQYLDGETNLCQRFYRVRQF